MSLDTVSKNILNIPKRWRYNLETPYESLLKLYYGFQYAFERLFKIENNLSAWNKYKLYKSKKLIRYFENGCFNFNGILLPDIRDKNNILVHLNQVYEDILYYHCNNNDKYDFELVNDLDSAFPEGSYCIELEDSSITIKPGDIVVDAGAWIGDFSAYAAHKGAMVYAFEPSYSMRQLLNMTSELNGNIVVVPYGLSDEDGVAEFSKSDLTGYSGSIINNVNYTGGTEKIELTTLDSFVSKNNVQKIDFIKADIEGAERCLLAGSKYVLKEFSPKLSICTYHLPDDPTVIREIILDANPKYKIVQMNRKLYAYIPETA